MVGADLVVAIPVDDFADVSDTGTGLGLRGQYRLRTIPCVSLRADVAFITYNYGQYIEYPYLIETRTQSIRFTAGPQLSIRYRRSELYLSPMYGTYIFYTSDNIAGYDITRARNTNTEFGWNINGGIMIGIARMPARSFDLALDVGGSWHSVRKGVVAKTEVDGKLKDVKHDVTEFCIQVGVVLLFR